MNRLPIRVLTWGTVLAALLSAWLLALEDNPLPEHTRNGARTMQLR